MARDGSMEGRGRFRDSYHLKTKHIVVDGNAYIAWIYIGECALAFESVISGYLPFLPIFISFQYNK